MRAVHKFEVSPSLEFRYATRPSSRAQHPFMLNLEVRFSLTLSLGSFVDSLSCPSHVSFVITGLQFRCPHRRPPRYFALACLSSMASVSRSWRTVHARSLLDSDPVAENLEPRSRYRPSGTWVGTVQEIYRVEREAGREPVAREEDRGRRTGTSRAQRDERRPRTLRFLQLILRRRLTYHMSPMTGVSAEPCRWSGFVQIARQLAFPLPRTKSLNRFPNCSSSPSPLTLPSLRCNLVTHRNRIQRTFPRSHWIPRSPPSFPRGISELPTGSSYYSRAQSWRALR